VSPRVPSTRMAASNTVAAGAPVVMRKRESMGTL
jgi:hypothetical protein